MTFTTTREQQESVNQASRSLSTSRRTLKQSQVGRSAAALIQVSTILYILFAVLFLPLVTVCTTGMRYLYCLHTVHKAAVAASLAQTFQTNNSDTDLSSINLAQQVVGQDITPLSGISMLQTNTFIVTTPGDGSAQTKQDMPLARPAQPGTNVYDVEVQLVANIQPLIAKNFLNARIPGLNTPITITTSAKEPFQNTLGLTQ
jgi:hypothetical protein